MIDLKRASLLDGLPRVLRSNADVQALAGAFHWMFSRLLDAAALVGCWSDLQRAPEHVLDELAVEWRTPNYAQDLPAATKRELLRETLPWWSAAGTVAATQEIVERIFIDAEITEWFEYGGEPYHFRVTTSDSSVTEDNVRQFEAAVRSVKRLSAWLEGVELALSTEPMTITYGLYVHSAAWHSLAVEI